MEYEYSINTLPLSQITLHYLILSFPQLWWVCTHTHWIRNLSCIFNELQSKCSLSQIEFLYLHLTWHFRAMEVGRNYTIKTHCVSWCASALMYSEYPSIAFILIDYYYGWASTCALKLVSGSDTALFMNTSVIQIKCVNIYTCDEGKPSLGSGLSLVFQVYKINLFCK